MVVKNAKESTSPVTPVWSRDPTMGDTALQGVSAFFKAFTIGYTLAGVVDPHTPRVVEKPASVR
jgi:hypothetical protein